MSNQITILVVDDEPKIRLLLRRCLETEGYNVLEASTAQEIETYLQSSSIDLITLDLNLGTENGLTIASSLRAKSKVPIIMVTGKSDVIDRVVGLEMGADDYITKPFHVREVLARVRTVLRRSNESLHTSNIQQIKDEPSQETRVYKFDSWSADQRRYELTDPTGKVVELTANDFKLLMVFLEKPQNVLSRDQIMDAMNGNDWSPYDRTIDNQVARLRKKIEVDPSHPQIIKTVRGVGYVFTANVTMD